MKGGRKGFHEGEGGEDERGRNVKGQKIFSDVGRKEEREKKSEKKVEGYRHNNTESEGNDTQGACIKTAFLSGRREQPQTDEDEGPAHQQTW